MPTTILDGETYEQARLRRFTEEAKVIEKIQQDEIIRMAREAGIVSNAYDAGFMDIFTKKLKRFAALIAAHEREKCFDAAMKAAEKAVDAAMLLEREACAKVCEEEHDKSKFGVNGMHCAAAIRARGEK